MPFPTKRQRIVIFPNRLIDGIQFIGIRLETVDIFICKIFRRFQVFADDPLAEGGDHFSRLKIDQTQKISRLNVSFIIGKALFQTVYGP